MDKLASCLKRKSLNQLTANEVIPDITTTNKDPKRVSFNSSKFVKPFAPDPEKCTVWDNTYEEAEYNSESSHIPECENLQNGESFCDILRFPCKSKVKVNITTKVEEYDKENYVPIARMCLNTSKIDMDMSLCMKENTTIDFGTGVSLSDVPKIDNYEDNQFKYLSSDEKSIVDFTCKFENRPIQENIAQELNMPEFNTGLENEVNDEELRNNLETIPDMELTTVLSTDILSSHKVIEQNRDLREINQENILNFSSTDDCTGVQNISSAMDFTCAPSNKQDITSTMDFTLAPTNNQNNTTCAPFNNQTDGCTGVQNIPTTMDFMCAPSNKQDITSTMDFTLAPINKQKNISTLTSVMDFTCNKQNITSDLGFTCAPNIKENITSAMDFTCAPSYKSELKNFDRTKQKTDILKDSKLEIDITCKYGQNFNNKELTEAASNLKNDSPENNDIISFDDSLSKKTKQSDSEVTPALVNESLKKDVKIQDLNDHKTLHFDQQTDQMELTEPFSNKTNISIINDKNTRGIVLTNEPTITEAENKKSCKSKSQNHVDMDGQRASKEKRYNLRSKTLPETISNDDSGRNQLTPKILNHSKIMVNTPGTSFAMILTNTGGIEQQDKPIYTSKARKARCLDSQKHVEDSLSSNLHKEFALSNPIYDHQSADYTIFNTTPLLMSLDSSDPLNQLTIEFDKSTEKGAMKNNFGLLQKSDYKLESIRVPDTTDLLLESSHSVCDYKRDDTGEIPNLPQTQTLSKDLLAILEESRTRVLHALEHFKIPKIEIIDLEELEKLENWYGESSNSRLSDGLLSTSIDNNSAEDADLECPKSLEERVREQAKRSIKYWQFIKCVNNDCYCFYTFYKAVPFKVHVDPYSGIVREIETFINLIDNALPSYFYEARYMEEKLKNDHLRLALGSKFDILTLLDYVVMCMEEIKAFDKEYDELENDFGQEHRFTMNPDFSITVEFLSPEFVLWWVITVDLSINHLGCITSAKARHNESTYEPVNEEEIKKIAQNTEGPLFIRNFINSINHYVKREGRKRLLQRKDDLKNKYNFLTF